MVIGVSLGLMSGYIGGKFDAFVMRVADIQLSFPAILIALLIDGVARAMLPKNSHDQLAVYVLILAIAASGWVSYARTVRGSTLVERNKEYVQAARVIGRHPLSIMFSHVLPNVLGPVLVIATLQIGAAIITESTLSFLGLGFPSDVPTWGRILYDARNYLDIAPHWAIFPGSLIFLTVLSINFIGDGLRDALDPRKTS